MDSVVNMTGPSIPTYPRMSRQDGRGRRHGHGHGRVHVDIVNAVAEGVREGLHRYQNDLPPQRHGRRRAYTDPLRQPPPPIQFPRSAVDSTLAGSSAGDDVADAAASDTTGTAREDLVDGAASDTTGAAGDDLAQADYAASDMMGAAGGDLAQADDAASHTTGAPGNDLQAEDTASDTTGAAGDDLLQADDAASDTTGGLQAVAPRTAPRIGRPPANPPAFLGNRAMNEIRRMLNSDVPRVLNDDRKVKSSVLAELKPLLLRVRHPSPILLEMFLKRLTSYGLRRYLTSDRQGPLNVTSTGFDRCISWMQTRASDLRSHLLHVIVEKHTEAFNDSYDRHPIWHSPISDRTKRVLREIWSNLLSPKYVDLAEFEAYEALQLVVQDVWVALDSSEQGVSALRQTTWRTAEIHVPSRTRWDIATSLELPPDEVVAPPPTVYEMRLGEGVAWEEGQESPTWGFEEAN